MKKTILLRKAINERTVYAIGAQDPFYARIVEKAGFDAIYLGSYALEARFLGRPDLEYLTKIEWSMIAANIARAIDIPIIADGEQGFGNAIHVIDTVRRFEQAGVAGIHIDDQLMPGICPFLPSTPLNRLISTEEMCGKIKAAVEARGDPDFLIIVAYYIRPRILFSLF